MDPSMANNPHVMRMMQDVAANAANVGKQAEFIDLTDLVNTRQVEVLNKNPKCASHAIFKKYDDELQLCSEDDDPQLLVKLEFTQGVKINGIALYANSGAPPGGT
eukprot:TRINITY_DN5412_c0_g1_i1.p2 TRINITY_DN5412_c0_g1~~TRINITY_DN5412_c0_g1_i1.p2  ORF type:complete len:105 (-),score=33.68 TRINITY_DN5412_c0_g1_i1:438-752(-)